MYAPVQVTPPTITPVTLDQAKRHLRVEVEDSAEDALITSLIAAATGYLDGWTGILGRCLCEQIWRQDFDAFRRELRLPLGPVIEIVSITLRSHEGQLSEVDSGDFALMQDDRSPFVRFREGYVPQADLAQVAVTYRAGYADVEATSDDAETEDVDESVPAHSSVPDAIKQAVLLLVGHWYANREAVVTGTIATEVPSAVASLVRIYRRDVI